MFRELVEAINRLKRSINDHADVARTNTVALRSNTAAIDRLATVIEEATAEPVPTSTRIKIGTVVKE